MKTHTVIACSVAFALGCGSRPSAAPPSSTDTSDAKPADPSASPGACTATMAKKRPPGWVDTGVLVVRVVDGRPTSLDVRDASGKSLGSQPVAADATGPAAREAIAAATCRAGAVLAISPAEPPKSGDVQLALVKPAKEDEPGDLGMLCTQPAEITPDFDPSQRVVIAAAGYEERLTSARWRGWLFSIRASLRTASTDADRVTIRRKGGADLSAAAKSQGTASCWFATELSR